MSQNLDLQSESAQSESAQPSHFVFRISPLIRITLMALYLALTIPLPFLSQASASPVPPWLLWLGIALGLVPLSGVLSERVIVDDEKIQVTYPRWVPGFFRKGWSLAWAEVKDLKFRSTGQGGIVYYFISKSEQKAYLLPMRVVGFARLVKLVEDKTAIDTTDVRPLSQPWMYLILLVFSLLLFVTDAWTIWMATTQGQLT